MSEVTHDPALRASASSAQAIKSFAQRTWPMAVVTLGLGLTAAWICLLGYGIARLIGMAI